MPKQEINRILSLALNSYHIVAIGIKPILYQLWGKGKSTLRFARNSTFLGTVGYGIEQQGAYYNNSDKIHLIKKGDSSWKL